MLWLLECQWKDWSWICSHNDDRVLCGNCVVEWIRWSSIADCSCSKIWSYLQNAVHRDAMLVEMKVQFWSWNTRLLMMLTVRYVVNNFILVHILLEGKRVWKWDHAVAVQYNCGSLWCVVVVIYSSGRQTLSEWWRCKQEAQVKPLGKVLWQSYALFATGLVQVTRVGTGTTKVRVMS